ncbi:MAG: hypothetical protein LHW46_06515 [Candidatus Cloacimonetes bacterium]|nr:hypothetical protein [Candidatus Cloacimonadota bacterium]MCB5268544.1 hypothetical protein [Candidatus Cloacimonadota bacterium]MDD2542899.1 hypothetical protein [Candidatus Cloacimonadota bacterium]MDD2683259.1 hypothetical protein [Candidatus Cloacimonadota bacterium]MDD4667297.1 hypothetical protein [Candidatus Cloacimonadota bacterium]
MLAQQKEAIYTLICSICYFIVLLILPLVFKGIAAESVLLLFALFISSIWILRKRSGSRFQAMDEMDKTIRLQAAIIATHAFGLTVAIYGIVLYLIHRGYPFVPIHQVLLLALHSWLSLYAFWSGSILYLYRRGALSV